jgi:hypothetical protein
VKNLYSILCLMMLIFTVTGCCGDEVKYPIYSLVSGYGPTHTWSVTKSHFEEVPKWNEKGEPPLAVGQAISIAKAWIISIGGSTNSFVDTVTFRSLQRGYPNDNLRPFWFYIIRFHDVFQFGSSVTCVVLLDGSVAVSESKPPTGRGPDYLD